MAPQPPQNLRSPGLFAPQPPHVATVNSRGESSETSVFRPSAIFCAWGFKVVILCKFLP
jgi:hypothetical protein